MKKIIGITMSRRQGQNPKNFLDYAYVKAVVDAGGTPVMIPNIGEEYASEYIKKIDGLILSGGSDVTPFYYGEDPHKISGPFCRPRDVMERAIYLEARKAGIPILGICRGMQVIASFEGGSLIQDIPSQYETDLLHVLSGPPYAVEHLAKPVPGTLIAELLGEEEIIINSIHHQAVKKIPEGFTASMHARDGMIEAMENVSAKVLALQYHPERLQAEYKEFRKLFRWIVEEAR
ncbi:MAG: gamma-glutamyl-gamma-aminobutyrate hydrolase family protein [Tissierellia bacterium]|nr:gamma-glutamyl-gamma-aminobutyrate hydrolase family protein [Tissierellia bacterium]